MKNVEDIYPLSPTQEGMLFHTLYDSTEAGIYVGQMTYEVRGALDVAALERAWQRVVERHAALRTAFLWEGLDQPMQVVRREAKLPFEQQDWQGMPPAVQRKWLASFLKSDRRRGFNAAQAPLMRIEVIRIAEDVHEFVWSFHQMVMDGWSLPLLTDEAALFYQAITAGRELALPRPRPYREYIEWLQRQDHGKAELFWRQALKGFTEPTPLPFDRPEGSAGEYGECETTLTAAVTDELQALARQNRLTLNTLVQGAWALLLAVYGGSDDVVFGATASGRPAELPRVEDMVGLFITTQPVRAQIAAEEQLGPWLRRLQELQLEVRQYEFSPLVEIQRWSEVLPGRPLFSSIVVFENYPQREAPPAEQNQARGDGGAIQLAIQGLHVAEQANYPLTLGVQMLPELLLRLNFDGGRFARATILRLLGHLERLLLVAARGAERRLGDLSPLAGDERHQLLVEWNDAGAAHAERRPVHELIAAQARLRPHSTALLFAERHLTYAELERRSNQLAHYLQTSGVRPGALVGVCLKRGADIAVAILAIFKAGGVYVPLDPLYPRERLAFMLADSGVAALVSEAELLAVLPSHHARVVCLGAEGAAIARCPAAAPDVGVSLEDLAYLIYTSGTTGKPKAVMVEHGNLIHTLLSSCARFAFGSGDLMLHLAPFSFDISLFELLNPLLAGGTSLVLPREQILDLPRLVEELQRATLVHAVPSLMRQVVAFLATGEDEAGAPRQLGLRTVFVGGDLVPAELLGGIRGAFPDARVFVLYGPTEGTIICASQQVDGGGEPGGLIGRPLANVSLLLLDRHGNPVPVGVTGELYIGGEGVTRGYLHRAELSAEKFVTRGGRRFYRTGDMGLYLPDGTLRFVGRVDQQLKVRGFRVEPVEIEEVLAAHPAVAEAVVTAHRLADENRLAAYVVPRAGRAPSTTELRQFTQRELPDYMVPASFVMLPALPLTPAGKIDRSALPAPEGALLDLEGFVAPRTRTEMTLAGIFAKVLGVEQVGINDDFLSLGGDSISALKATGMASRLGLRFTPKQLFENPTVASLAAVVGQAPAIRADRGLVQGAVPLSPFQRRFFDLDPPAPQHWTRTLLAEVAGRLDPLAAGRVLEHILRHHDALRLRFTRQQAEWKQTGAPPDDKAPFLLLDLAALPRGAQERAFDGAAMAAQGSLDLGRGPLLRVLACELGKGQPGRLLLVAHRLVADAASLQILLEDLELGYRQLGAGEAIVLASKMTSFKYWAERMTSPALAAARQQELRYWLGAARSQAAPLPLDFPSQAATWGDIARVSTSLHREESRLLLDQVPRPYRMRVQEVLLAALAVSVARRHAIRSLLVAVEISGREKLLEDVSVVRTVGPFSDFYSLVLAIGDEAAGPAAVLKTVKEQIRAVPGGGEAYPALRLAHAGEMQALPEANLLFRHRLAAGPGGQGTSLLTPAGEVSGGACDPRLRREHALELQCEVAGDRVKFDWLYSTAGFSRATIEGLADELLSALRALAAHCLSAEAGGVTPADFPLAKLTQVALEKLAGRGEHLEDIYPLTPLQQGMLFHTLLSPEEGHYVTQIGFQLQGALDLPAFERAWQEVVEIHPVLRTAFALGDFSHPLQLVYRQVKIPFTQEDWTALGAAEQHERIAAYREADRRRGFELDRPPLMRLALFRLTQDLHQFIWTCHHALLDGWCQSMVFDLAGRLYAAFRSGKPHPLIDFPRPYRDYIAWLQQQDPAAAESYWRRLLAGFSAPTPLAVDGLAAAGGKGGGERRLRLAPAETEALVACARRQRLTLGTVLQGAWALLLSRYSGQDDVVFGLTVAGRPPELAGADEMVGLFINTVPVRARFLLEEALAFWLKTLQSQQVESRQYEYAPLAELQKWSEVAPGQPLFRSILVLQNPEQRGREAEGGAGPDLGFSIRQLDATEGSNYPLTAAARPAESLVLFLAYHRALFDAATVDRALGHWQELLRGFVADPEGSIAGRQLLTAAERHQLHCEWSDTAVPTADGGLIHELLAARAALQPAVPAVEHGTERLSYRDLDRQANRLAHRLRELGVGPESRVAICLERSPAVAVALLGAWKAGGACIPLDPEQPHERLAWMLGDAAPAVLLTSRALAAELPAGAAAVVCLEELDEPSGTGGEDRPPQSGASAGTLAYAIYTSGSTGRPKAVLVEHGNLASTLLACQRRFGFAASDSMLHLAPFSFDIALFELLNPLLAGGTALLLARHEILDVDHLLERLEEATCFHAVPSLMRRVVDAAGGAEASPPAGSRLRTVFVGGDRVPPELLRDMRQVFPGAEIVVLYGPTEATIICASYRANGDLPDTPLLGRPLDNVVVRLGGAAGRAVPVGVPGELHVGGPGVTRGYLNRPEMTQERYGVLEDQRFYRTGDIARYLPDGTLEFIGRGDQQVKVRGFRVEPGEIEAALASHPAVAEVVVVPWAAVDGEGAGAPPAEGRLIAYLVPRRPAAQPEAAAPALPGAAELRQFAERLLPDYMIPAAFMGIEALPLLPNGKLDRHALPPPQGSGLARRQGSVAPRTPIEEALAGIWCQVLGIDRVGIDDNFFALGGHSLLAIQAVSRIRGALAVDLALGELFEFPTLGGLAGRLEAALRGAGRPLPPPLARQAYDDLVAASFAQQRLWWLQQLQPDNPAYNLTLPMRLRAPLHITVMEEAFSEVLRRHEALRTGFVSVDGEPPLQSIQPPAPWRSAVVDLGGLPAAVGEEESRRLAVAEALRPFDLAGGLLLRCPLLRLGEADHVFLLTVHHLAGDGRSMNLLMREIVVHYRALAAGRPSPLPPLPVQYADYALWQREWLQGEVLAAELEFWRQRLAGAPKILHLPIDRPRPALPGWRGDRRTRPLPGGVLDALRAYGRSEGATTFMSLLAVLQALLGRYSGQERVAIGTPNAGRNQPETEPLIGVLVNTLVLMSDLSGEPTFRELLLRVRETSLQAYAHSDLPFAKLVEALRPQRTPGATPLFQVLFSLAEARREEGGAGGARAEDLGLEMLADESKTVMFDLNLQAAEHEASCELTLSFSTQLFDAVTIERMLRDLVVLAQACAGDPERRPQEVELLGEMERYQVSVDRTVAETAGVELEGERTATPLERDLAAVWSDLLGAAPVAPDDDLFALGGDSWDALRLLARLERISGIQLSLSALLANPTVEHLAGLLRQRGANRLRHSLVPLRRAAQGNGPPPLFLVPSASGQVLRYSVLARELGPDLSVYAFQTMDRGAPGSAASSVEQIAAEYVEELLCIQSEGGYHLAGWSRGALVAFEMARQLRIGGRRVAFLGLLDPVSPGALKVENDLPDFLHDLGLAIGSSGGEAGDRGSLRELPLEEQLATVLRDARAADEPLPELGIGELRRLYEVYRRRLAAMSAYQPQFYPGRINVYRTGGRPSPNAELRGLRERVRRLFDRLSRGSADSDWARFAGEVKLQTVSGNGGAAVRLPQLEALARQLKFDLQGIAQE